MNKKDKENKKPVKPVKPVKPIKSAEDKKTKIEKRSIKSDKNKIVKPVKKSKGGDSLSDLTGSLSYTVVNGFNMAKYMIIEIGNILNTGAQFKQAINPNMTGATPGNSVYNTK